ncbi:MAG: zinc-dependent metalloprotease [Thermoanaerobaculia bacterium]|nr:zinc-dependent metalloprotease [Thermoanaerobaculia bacterium]
MSSSSPLRLFFATTCLLVATQSTAQDIHVTDPAPPGQVVHDTEGVAVQESLRLHEKMSRALTASDPGAILRLEGFPVAPGERQPILLDRFQVYAPSARIVVMESRREAYEIPLSRHLHFLGETVDGSTRVGLSVDPDSGAVSGLTIGPAGTMEILSANAAEPLAIEVRDAALSNRFLETTCNSEDLPVPAEAMERASKGHVHVHEKGAAPTYQVTIAVDTDNEFHHLRFGNNTTAATNYLSNLFLAMNVYYHRDVDLNLLLGETIFRLDTDPVPTYDDDPYTVTSSPANQSGLQEFGSYWSANHGAVDRTFAILLSGKSSSDFSTSGIAWVDGYCETQSTGGGYSYAQTFKFTSSVVSSGARLIAHEIGHNLGSPHTHCYSPPIDQCYNQEGGCFAGAVSCPVPEGNGTIMSYCHFSSGADCGSSRDEFHPTVANLFDGFLTAHFPGCVEAVSTDTIFEDGFESGNTSAWSSTSP